MLVARLQTIHHAQHLGRIPPRRGRIAESEPDRLLGVDNEHAADGEGDALAVDVGRVLVVEHVVEIGHFALLVANDGELELRPADLVDVLDPSAVRLDGVGRQTDQLDIAPCELGLQFGEGAEFCSEKCQ